MPNESVYIMRNMCGNVMNVCASQNNKLMSGINFFLSSLSYSISLLLLYISVVWRYWRYVRGMLSSINKKIKERKKYLKSIEYLHTSFSCVGFFEWFFIKCMEIEKNLLIFYFFIIDISFSLKRNICCYF